MVVKRKFKYQRKRPSIGQVTHPANVQQQDAICPLLFRLKSTAILSNNNDRNKFKQLVRIQHYATFNHFENEVKEMLPIFINVYFYLYYETKTFRKFN